MTFEEMAVACSALMDAVEADNLNGSSSDEGADPRLVTISEYATLLESFRPDLLDKRFRYSGE
jgi:hypothetical protein